MMRLVSSLSTPTNTAVVIGAAIVLFYLFRKRGGKGGGSQKRAASSSTAIPPLGDRLPDILSFIRQAQVEEDAKVAVDAVLYKYYGKWFGKSTGVAGTGAEGKPVKVKLGARTPGDVGLAMLEGLQGERDGGLSTESSLAKVRGPAYTYSYMNDLSLPSELTEEVLASVAAAPIRIAFETAEIYYELCKDRRTAAQEARVVDEATYSTLLEELWRTSFATIDAPAPQPNYARQGDGWGELGFQGKDPITDLRGGGLLSLEDYVRFAANNKALHEAMVLYNRNEHATGGAAWFLEACVSIQLTVQLTTSNLDGCSAAPTPSTSSGNTLLKKRAAAPSSSSSPLRFTPAIAAYLYNGPSHEARDRLQHLHGLYFKAFFALWQRERPFVMEYQGFMDKSFYPESPVLVEGYLAEEAAAAQRSSTTA